MGKENEVEVMAIEVGDRVSHSVFGEGFAREVTRSSNGHDMHISIEFDEAYQKSELLPATRFRKILSTWVTKVNWEEVIEGDDTLSDITIDGLEGSGLVKFDFTDQTTGDYTPTPEEKLELENENIDQEQHMSAKLAGVVYNINNGEARNAE